MPSPTIDDYLDSNRFGLRIKCMSCGAAFPVWTDDDGPLPYERWLKRPCDTCGKPPTDLDTNG